MLLVYFADSTEKVVRPLAITATAMAGTGRLTIISVAPLSAPQPSTSLFVSLAYCLSC